MFRKLTVIGGGNAAHVLAGLASSKGISVSVLTSFQDEAEKWNAESINLLGQTEELALGKDSKDHTRIHVTSSAAEAVSDADLVVFAVPAFAHQSYASAIAPFLQETCTIGAMPGEGCFELEMRQAGIIKPGRTIFATETLPWACRIEEYGNSVRVLGVKKNVDVAVSSGAAEAVRAKLQALLGNAPIVNTESTSFLGVTLMNINAIWHPTIVYGQYHMWDGHSTFAEAPLFYEGVGEFTAHKLEQVSTEIMHIRAAIESLLQDKYRSLVRNEKNDSITPSDLSIVRPVTEWMTRMYGSDIADSSSLGTMIRTNLGYIGLRHPVVRVATVEPHNDVEYLPDFQNRYFTEDVPFGMLVNKGIAELAGVETPVIDEIIAWVQTKTGKTYIQKVKRDDDTSTYKVADSNDLKYTRCPQRFGYTDLVAFVRDTQL